MSKMLVKKINKIAKLRQKFKSIIKKRHKSFPRRNEVCRKRLRFHFPEQILKFEENVQIVLKTLNEVSYFAAWL